MLDACSLDIAKPLTARDPPYLATLNAQQRVAVEHGVGVDADDRRPLLIIAGAGSGKTSTLACRAAHLIANGADPQRLLLLTFSRRAAEALERRAGQVLQRAEHDGIDARRRCCRGPARFTASARACCASTRRASAVNEAFSILDRADAEDLLDLVRHDLGLSATKSRFPAKGTCVAIYSRVVNGGTSLDDVLAAPYTVVRAMGERAARSSSKRTSLPSRRRTSSTTTISCSTGRDMVAEPSLARDIGERFDHVLVDEYQDTNRLQSSILLAIKPDGAASPSSATTRSRSIRFARRPCATSSTFRARSSRPRAS